MNDTVKWAEDYVLAQNYEVDEDEANWSTNSEGGAA